jgi:hypothetical protein
MLYKLNEKKHAKQARRKVAMTVSIGIVVIEK